MAGKRALYQSDLVKQPYTVILTSEVQHGQYGPFVRVRLTNGEEKILNLENESIAALMAEYPQGVPLTISGHGTKGRATVQVVEHTPERQKALAKEMAPAGAVRGAIFADMQQCWEAAGLLTENEAVRGTICNSMFIEFNKSGGQRPIMPEETEETQHVHVPQKKQQVAEGHFLDSDAGFRNHAGKTWRQMCEEVPDGVEWAIKNLRRLTDDQRELLSLELERLTEATTTNPFLDQQDDLPF